MLSNFQKDTPVQTMPIKKVLFDNVFLKSVTITKEGYNKKVKPGFSYSPHPFVD